MIERPQDTSEYQPPEKVELDVDSLRKFLVNIPTGKSAGVYVVVDQEGHMVEPCITSDTYCTPL